MNWGGSSRRLDEGGWTMKGFVISRGSPLTVVLGVVFAALSFPANAQELVLKGVAAFQEGSIYASKFEAYIKEVNERGRGLIRIQYLGGVPKVMPIFEVSKNLRDGVIDIISTAGSYYTNIMPEADAQKLIEVPMSELRRNGGFEYMNKLHAEKANSVFLARLYNYEQLHLYLNKEVTKPDFSQLKIRVTPMYRAVVEKLGGTAITSAPTDVYTMMERNTVDGFGWAARGIFDYSWQKVTKYRLDPGFFTPDISLQVNQDVWTKKMNDAQRALLLEIALKYENAEGDVPLIKAELDAQEKAGMKVIRFSPEDQSRFLITARDAAWEAVMKASPEHGPKLREYFIAKK
jgi:TRAP-type C4-dicarboxylate transport system substrate-binding protein